MGFFTQHAGLRQSVALLLSAILCGCASWQPVQGLHGYVAAFRPEHVRAELTSGARVDLYGADVVGTQLVGLREKGVEASRI